MNHEEIEMMKSQELRHGRLLVIAGLIAVAFTIGLPQRVEAQTPEPTSVHACYVPEVGALYRINEPGLPEQCFETTHIPFSWDMLPVDCTEGQVAHWDGSEWACTDLETLPHDHVLDDITDFPSCNTDQIIKRDGSAWVCAEDASGLTGWTRVINSAQVDPGEGAAVYAWCPSGTLVTGGGFSAAAMLAFQVSISTPTVAGEGWLVVAYNSSANSENISVSAVCASSGN